MIALPSARGYQVEHIVDKCRQSKVSFKILPPMSEQLNGTASVKQFRKVRVEDLLSRNPVQLNHERIREQVQDKVLLITGAGGSIGSELSRQIATFEPRRLVLFERSENDLFRIGLVSCCIAPRNFRVAEPLRLVPCFLSIVVIAYGANFYPKTVTL